MKALIIIASVFNPLELYGVLNLLIDNEFGYTVISTRNPVFDENVGEPLEIHYTIDEFLESGEKVDDYAGLFIISGGPGPTFAYWVDPRIERIVKEFDAKSKILAAICCSVPSIRYACNGKKVTCYPLVDEKRLLREAGAILTDTSLMIDDRIVTAEHQIATIWWAKAAIDLMKGELADHHMREMFESMTMKHGKRWRKALGIE